jgi:hypothetical protein
LGSSPFARHYSGSRDFFPFLRLLRCFSSPACRPCPMYSGRGTRALPRVGFPIRTSRDQRMVSSFPGLFAAAHVLLRLLAPRHPPCALSLLIMKNTVVAAMEFSRCTRPLAPSRKAGRAGLSKLNSVNLVVEVDVILGDPSIRTATAVTAALPSTGSGASGVIAPDSLERR